MKADTIYLRPMETADIDQLYNWQNDRTLYETLGGPFRFISRAALTEWLQKRSSYNPDEVNLAICLSESHKYVGNIYLRSFDWIGRKAELTGIFIGDREMRGKGIGREALHLVMQHAFEDLGLVRLWTYILESNIPSRRLFEGAGWKVEGTLQQHALKKGEYLNVLIAGVLRTDWREG